MGHFKGIEAGSMNIFSFAYRVERRSKMVENIKHMKLIQISFLKYNIASILSMANKVLPTAQFLFLNKFSMSYYDF